MRRLSARRAAAAAALATVGGLAAVLLVAAPASAAPLSVTNNDSSGPGSLQQAILDANGTVEEDIITFSAAVTSPLTLTEALPQITEDLVIDGPGSGELLIMTDEDEHGIRAQGDAVLLTIDGLSFDTIEAIDPVSGIFSSQADVVLTDVRVNGYPNFGLETLDSDVTATDSVFSDNGTGGIWWLGDGTDIGPEGLDLTRVDANNNTVGIYIEAAGSTEEINLTSVEARLNTDRGVWFDGPENVDSITITDGQYWENGVGIDATLVESGQALVVGAHIHHNDGSGIVADLTDAGVFGLIGATIESNGLVTAVNGGGISAALDSSAIVTAEGTRIADNSGILGGGVYISELLGAPSGFAMQGSELVDNTASADGGGLYVGVAGSVLGASASVSFLESRITGNTAQGSGGGVLIDSFGNGVVFSGGFAAVSTTFDDNHATDGDGGGIRINEFSNTPDTDYPFITFDGSTLSNNTATNGAGGAFSFVKNGTTLPDPTWIGFENSTISGNDADIGGGGHILGGDGTADDMELTMQFVTITDNSQGLFIDDDEVAFTLTNSILGGNHSQDLTFSPADPSYFTPSYSNVEVAEAVLVPLLQAGPGNQVGIDPQLGPLADNGWLTLTHVPQAGSPVVDAADPAFTVTDFPETDQRREARVLGGRADMGAVESPRILPATGGGAEPMLVLGALFLLLTGAAFTVARRRTA